jgi:hypothetical protein
MKIHYVFCSAVIVTLTFLSSCSADLPSQIKRSQSEFTDSSYTKLSETGLYVDMVPRKISEDTLAFQPNFALWTDGAEKRRWIYLPEESKIISDDMDRWEFPTGTKLWKEFSFLGKRIETRLMEKVGAEADQDSWKYYAFAWNEEETEAVLVDRLGKKDVAFTGLLPSGEPAVPISAGTSHDIPTQGSCARCHNRGGDPVLGFSAVQLSNALDQVEAPLSAETREELVLTDLINRNRLTNPPATMPDIPTTDPLTRQSLGFLHANCSGCHNSKSSAGRITGMYLNLDTTATTLAEEPAIATALDQLTSNYEVPGRTLGADSYLIEPGKPESSAVFLRMSARGSFEQMPPLGSEAAHLRDIELLRQWIGTLQ